MTKIHLHLFVKLSILAALTVILGIFIKFPTPTGFVSILDVGIYFTAFYFGSREGAIVDSLSGFLIDLLSGYPQWMFFSLINHGLQGLFSGFKGKKLPLGLILSSISMIGGYYLGGAIIAGANTSAFISSLAEVPSNFMQNLVGIILGFILAKTIKKIEKR